jgi:hypothetical protein
MSFSQNFNIEFVSPECSLQLDFWAKLRIKLWIPIILSMGSAFIDLMVTMVRTPKSQRVKRALFAMRKALYVLDKIILLLFTLITSSFFSVFDCTMVQPGVYVMRLETTIQCFDSKWKREFVQVGIFGCLYLIAFPLRLVWIYRKMYLSVDAMYNPNYYHLIKGFKRHYYWWDIVNVLKRLLFVLGAQFIFNSLTSTSRTMLSGLILFGFFWLETFINPYMSGAVAKNNWNFVLVLILLCQALVFDQPDSQSDIFVFFVFAMVVLCCCHTGYEFVFIFRKAKNRVVITHTAANAFGEEIMSLIHQSFSEEQLRLRGEFQFDVRELIKNNAPPAIVEELFAFRRSCDVLFDEAKLNQAELIQTQTRGKRTVDLMATIESF